jgi:hypothetical protein
MYIRGAFKVIGLSKGGYGTFFLRNNNKGATFELAACPTSSGQVSLAEALNASENCTPFQTMRLYYPQDDQKIFLRAKSGNRNNMPLEETEKRKARALSRFEPTRRPMDVGYYLNTNRGAGATYNLSPQIDRKVIFLGVKPVKLGPFDREYLTIQLVDRYRRDTARSSGTQQQSNLPNVPNPLTPSNSLVLALDEAISKRDEKEIMMRYQDLRKKGNGVEIATGTYNYAEYLINAYRYKEAEQIIDDVSNGGKLQQDYYDKLTLLKAQARSGLGDEDGASRILKELASENHSKQIRDEALRLIQQRGEDGGGGKRRSKKMAK